MKSLNKIIYQQGKSAKFPHLIFNVMTKGPGTEFIYFVTEPNAKYVVEVESEKIIEAWKEYASIDIDGFCCTATDEENPMYLAVLDHYTKNDKEENRIGENVAIRNGNHRLKFLLDKLTYFPVECMTEEVSKIICKLFGTDSEVINIEKLESKLEYFK